MITKDKMLTYWAIYYQILSMNTVSKCMEISVENLNMDTGALRIKQAKKIASV